MPAYKEFLIISFPQEICVFLSDFNIEIFYQQLFWKIILQNCTFLNLILKISYINS